MIHLPISQSLPYNQITHISLFDNESRHFLQKTAAFENTPGSSQGVLSIATVILLLNLLEDITKILKTAYSITVSEFPPLWY